MYNLLIPIGLGIITYLFLEQNDKKDKSNVEFNKKSPNVVSCDHDRKQDSDNQEHYRERLKNAEHQNNCGTGRDNLSGDLDQESGSSDPKHYRVNPESKTETET